MCVEIIKEDSSQHLCLVKITERYWERQTDGHILMLACTCVGISWESTGHFIPRKSKNKVSFLDIFVDEP